MADGQRRALHRAYCYTINNYTEADLEAVRNLRCEYKIYGKEVGANGTPHLQCYSYWKNPKLFSALKKQLPRAHIEPARGTAADNRKYCSKDGDFCEEGSLPKQGKRTDIAKMWEMIVDGKTDAEIVEDVGPSFALHRKRLRDMDWDIKNAEMVKKRKTEFEEVELKAWQVEAMCRLEEQGDRKVLFVVDEKGGMGKSWLGDYLTFKKDAMRFDTTKRTDCTYAYKDEKIVVFDLCRHDKDHINYGTIEQFKNKQMFSSKYESRVKLVHCKSVIVFMNEMPDMTKLSEDRYDILIPEEYQ